MKGSIRLYGGVKARMPALPERMPGWCTDTRELYMGTGGGNVLIARELPAAEAVAPLSAQADTAAVIAAFNGLLAALKAAGVMKEA